MSETTRHDADLRRLARLYGVGLSYRDVWGRRRACTREAVRRVLEALGAPIASARDVRGAVRERLGQRWRETLEPVAVAWDGRLAPVRLRLPAASLPVRFRCRLAMEQGGEYESSGVLGDLPGRRRRELDGAQYAVKLLAPPAIPGALAPGYHRLSVEWGERRAESMVVSAPVRAHGEAADRPERHWGVFLPLYALRRGGARGVGDFSDLEALMTWVARLGGGLVATLPLLSTLWELDGDPSPYSASSRLFWNELYLDARRIPELAQCPRAARLLDLADHAEAAAGPPRIADRPLVDFRREASLKRQVLEELAAACFERFPARRAELERFAADRPDAADYARFRAVGERQGAAWPAWPGPLRAGAVAPGDCDEAVYRYHLFCQWQVDEQLRAMAEHAGRERLLWYLDFPLGVNGAGYDVWRHRETFAVGASGGAPPDAFFTKGQDWGFPPLHPERMRRQRYRYWIAALRRHLECARVLRLDHVMGLYRLYWVPHGLEARDGAYVRYPMDEMLAVLALESHRYGARIVGENLGTVPEAVDAALTRHGIDAMYVVQYEAKAGRRPPLRPAPAAAVSSVNTHDMPQFAAWWTGLEIDDRAALGLLTPGEAAEERTRRAVLRREIAAMLAERGLLPEATLDPLRVLAALLGMLAESPTSIVLVNLEDLWLETEPQNTPGTYLERPNWRRRARYTFEEFTALPAVRNVLEEVARRRRG